MSDVTDRIENDETAFQRLLSAIPGFDGYREREIRRAADKLLRDRLVADLDDVRAALRDVVADWARQRRLSELPDIDRLTRLMGKVRDNIRFADYGYTGFFDAVKIKEDQLDHLYAYDLKLTQKIAACKTAVEALAAAPAADAKAKMDAVEAATDELQHMVDSREEVAFALVEPDSAAPASPSP